MLVISRQKQEQIVIGDGEITLTVVRTGSDKVRIGVDAPKSVPINRKEVYDAIKRDGGDLNRLKAAEGGEKGARG